MTMWLNEMFFFTVNIDSVIDQTFAEKTAFYIRFPHLNDLNAFLLLTLQNEGIYLCIVIQVLEIDKS